ncbi:hypothetical protein Dfri01_39100 [Dyadobacter frigoris]|uniref:hypothetical protein n=1 Tax=Dyadobacter frigoris TaxID=2576211 RepID=UPI0024A34E2E|nr:hypothetical protein [Dyadobacter frigoris]GLU54449.1 hypothetical protein Dfri01_39100 [Dyadobacter frigoris]
MKKYLKFLVVALVAVVAAHLVPLFSHGDAAAMALAVAPAFASFANLRNIPEQLANPAGIRRIGVIAIKDLAANVLDWPRVVGATTDVNLETMEITLALPVAQGKTVAVIEPADNSAFADFENQGDRYYQSYKIAMGFDIAGLTKAQSIEMRKFLNTGAIFFVEGHDGEIRVYGSKLAPIVLKSKGSSGKKGGDKRGYSMTGDNDSLMTEPPFYPSTLALPGMFEVVV